MRSEQLINDAGFLNANLARSGRELVVFTLRLNSQEVKWAVKKDESYMVKDTIVYVSRLDPFASGKRTGITDFKERI